MIFLVSYDLKVPGRDYSKLYETLKSAEAWWHHLESTWVLSSRYPLSHWNDRIRSALDENDSFLIVDIVGKERNGWLPKQAWEWLNQNDHPL